MARENLGLTVGPVQFNWPAQRLADFYARVADEAPVDCVVIGETVCSKRAPFYADRLPAIIDRLERAGKKVVLTSLIMITLERERRAARELCEQAEHEIEIADLSMLRHLEAGPAFSVGPTVNVYNEATLAFLARLGARSFCLPPELPFASVETLARTRPERVGIEVWAFGRMPLAISGRCTHARIHGLTKDSCQFVCEKDADGLAARTLDGADFLAVNGVQTLSHKYANLAADIDRIADAGVTSFRLSPQSGNFVAVARAFADAIEKRIFTEEALGKIAQAAAGAEFTNGFLFGSCGAAPLVIA
ncbi:MAG: U32 family peptidase [Methylocystis sp.]